MIRNPRGPDRANRGRNRRIGGYDINAKDREKQREAWLISRVEFRKKRFIAKIAQPGYEPTSFDELIIDQIKAYEKLKSDTAFKKEN